uniref:Uncharacterized protein n=1 Tax=Tanacetum cinerariifolium TaxID=118510 RepID=A0A6L2KHJ5_TANCI|nr:hypothetical protein [Tanacetum cinerariifolium]
MELKKILIEKMEGNKSIQRSDEQRNLYKALVDAYEADKTIFDSYGETVILKKRRDDDDDDQEEGPSAGSDQGSKRRREGKEPESASAPLETATRSAGRSTTGSKSRQVSASESAFVEEPMQTISQIDEPSYLMFETGADDQTIIQSSQHPKWFSQPKKPPTLDHDWSKTLPVVQGSTQTCISELAKVDTLTPKLLPGPTFELMKGSCTSLIELEYHLEEVSEIVTRGFTLIVLSALRRSDNENTLSLTIIILRSILTDLQETLKRMWRYLIPAESQIHNHMLIPDYQDIKFQDFRYSDSSFPCFILPFLLLCVCEITYPSTSCWKDNSREAWNALLVEGT